jgi:ethanolamine utilization protein EutN
MQTAAVLGFARATVKHESFNGQKLVIVQPLAVQGDADGPPLVVLDGLGCRRGDIVIISSDGLYARDLTNHENTPARWTVFGIIDES